MKILSRGMKDYLAEKQAADIAAKIDEELASASETKVSSTATATETISKLTVVDLKKAESRFIPEIWSKKLLSRFYDNMALYEVFRVPETRSEFFARITEEIKNLSAEGLTPDQIAEKIDPDLLARDVFDGALANGKIGSISGFKIYASKVIEPGSFVMMGKTTS